MRTFECGQPHKVPSWTPDMTCFVCLHAWSDELAVGCGGRCAIVSERTGARTLQAFDVLGILVSLTGGLCSMTCSLLLPALFFACLYWQELQAVSRCGIVALLSFGMCMLVLIVTQNLQAMRSQLQARHVGFVHLAT